MAGKYFDELEVGAVFQHQPSREISHPDNLQFCKMTYNPQPLHFDEEFAAASEYGQIIINSLYTLGLVIGVSVEDTTLGTTLGNLGMEKTEFPNPVFIGDTLTVSTEVLEKRASKTKADRGVVWFLHTAVNQRNELVCECVRKAMMLRQLD